MKVDETTLQVLANYCAAAAESMGWTLMRTAYSTFVKETEDFSCQILTPEGLTVASPKTFGATWYTGLDYSRVVGLFDYQEGDICVVSDPYSGFVATHTPDVHMWKPVFRDGRIVCFVGNHIHNTDVGGAVPASLSRSLTEIQQEGVRIPPMRIMRDGVLNEEALRLLMLNVRLPEQNRGDLNAQIACVNVGERKVHEIIDRVGVETFSEGLNQLLDYAEAQSRKVISELPDGEYFFADYADEDQADGYPIRLAVTLKIHGDSLTLDYTGSDPQLASSMNMPTGGNERHSLVMVGFIYALYCLDPTVMLNSGSVRPVRAVLPQGTIVNAVSPAAVGMRSLTCSLSQVVVFGAFCRVRPEMMPACPGSAVSIMNVKTTARGGRTVMASIGPVGGGAGGDAKGDGVEASGANGSYLKNTPIEISEAEMPISFLRYGLVTDSGGAGRFRGGLAVEMEFAMPAPQSTVTARNRDRSVFAPWGVQGGRAGITSRFVRNPERDDRLELGVIDVVQCGPDDRILIQGPGGGGYGDPLGRQPDAVLDDVRRGFVSVAGARRDYGVVIDANMRIDAAATADLRASKAGKEPVEEFGHSAGRLAHETVWSRPRYDAMTAILREVPVTWRFFVKHRLFAAMKGKEGLSVAPVYEAYAALTGQFDELPALSAPKEAVAG